MDVCMAPSGDSQAGSLLPTLMSVHVPLDPATLHTRDVHPANGLAGSFPAFTAPPPHIPPLYLGPPYFSGQGSLSNTGAGYTAFPEKIGFGNNNNVHW